MSAAEKLDRQKLDRRRNGMSKWHYDADNGKQQRNVISPLVQQWERENGHSWHKQAQEIGAVVRRSGKAIAMVGFAFTLGFALASGPDSAAANIHLRDQLSKARSSLNARDGELELARLELTRLNSVMENSRRYDIPAGLASSIYDIAVAEGIDPRIAFSLVNVESEFFHKAVSPVGALGLTQVMPATGRMMQPGLERADLFDPETNLRLGFRFLRDMISRYNGDVDLALHAYNRGPSVVDRILKSGGDPANGYADAILKDAGK